MANKFIHYYNPNLDLSSLICFLSPGNRSKRLEKFFSEYSGKRYILLTFSARSALYLAYQALNLNGEVITSPLTCFTAVSPIIKAGNTPVFADINKDDFTLNPEKTEESVTKNSIAVQAIHFGGIPCEMERLSEIAKKKNLILIEDCAQGYGAKYDGKSVGTFGDIAVFSLAKNLLNIIGGVLATNDRQIFLRAKIIQDKFEKNSARFLFYRVLRNYLKTKNNRIGNYYYFRLMDLKNMVKDSTKNREESLFNSVENYLKKPSESIFNLSYKQLKKSNRDLNKRISKGNKFAEILSDIEEIQLPVYNDNKTSSFVKLFLKTKGYSPDLIEYLNKNGIEAKHLEEEYNIFYQPRFDNLTGFRNNSSIMNCPNYIDIHDRIISLPLSYNLPEDDMLYIKNVIKNYYHSKCKNKK